MSYDRLLERVQLFYKLATYGKRDKFLRAMGQQGEVIHATPVTIEGTPPPVINATPVTITGTPPPEMINATPVTISGTPPAVSAETQGQLNDLLVPKGAILPLKLDGLVGPQTQKAQDAFKAKYNVPATAANIKAVHLKEFGPASTKAPFPFN